MPANTSPIGISNVNVELNYSANTLRAFDDAIFRNLSGNSVTNTPQSRIGFSDVDGKIAFGGLTSPDASNSAFGSSQAISNLVCISDMFSPTVDWSTAVVSGSINVKLVVTGPKTAQLILGVNDIGTFTSNVGVTVALSYAGHPIGNTTQYVALSGTVFNPALTLIGTFSVNNAGYTAQTASTTVRASANATLPANATVQFIVDPGVGASINGNNVTFSCSTSVPGNDNTQIYSLTTNLLYQNNIIATNTSTVTVRATYLQPAFNFAGAANANNQFANSGAVTSSLIFTADHNVADANVVWSVIPVSGPTPSLTIGANNEFANVFLSTTGFGFQKSVANVVATLQYANGYILASNSSQVTLRAGAYGLTFTPPASSVAANGYGAQTATTTAAANWQAGTFAWNAALVSGSQANVASSVLQTSASLVLTLSTGAATSNLISVNAVNPTITFDGIVVANVQAISTLTATNLPYTFSIAGPTQNSQIANTASVIQTVTQNVASGVLSFSFDNPSVNLTSNSTTAVLTLASVVDGATIASGNLTCTLVDSSSRLVNAQIIPVTLRIYNANVVFSGANNVSILGYAAGQQANTTITVRIPTGANLSFAAVKTSGANAAIANLGGNTTQQIITLIIQEPPSSFGTAQGFYNMTANVTFFGQSASYIYPISIAATQLNPNLHFSFSNGSFTDFGPTALASANATASHSVPGGTLTWSSVVLQGNTFGAPVSNATSFSFQESANAVGSQTAILAVTASVFDANGLFAASTTANVQAVATFADPNLVLVGNTNVLVSNVFAATATATVNASVNALFTNAQFSFSVTKISGAANAAITTGANGVIITMQKSGVGSANAVYSIASTVRGADPTIVDTATTQVTINANCPQPPLAITPVNAASSSYNYPVTATASVTAASTPAGSVTWATALASGSASGITISSNTSKINFAATQSAIGTVAAVYNVTATYLSPAGVVIGTQSTSISVSATRLNPGFALSYPLGQNVNVVGWETALASTVQVQASVAAGVPTSGLVYNWTVSQNGDTGTLTSNATTGISTLTLTNNRTTDGLGEKGAALNASCTLSLNGQVIAGPLSGIGSCQINPYYINLVPSPSNNVSSSANYAIINVTAVTNSPAINTTNIIWQTTQTGGNATFVDTFSGTGTSNSTLIMSLVWPPYIGSWFTTYNVVATLVANGATRSSAALATLQTAAGIVNEGGSGGLCVEHDSWMDEDFQAVDVLEGISFRTWSPETGFGHTRVEKVADPIEQPCWRLVTACGAVLICSESTPFNLQDAKSDLDPEFSRLAPQMLGESVMVVDTYSDKTFWDQVVFCESVGSKLVVPISFGGKSFAAGAKKELLIFSHNMAKPPAK